VPILKNIPFINLQLVLLLVYLLTKPRRRYLMADNSALLSNLFQAVTKTLVDNQQSLNQADDRNHDHGTNMVQTFQTITQALEKKQGSSGSDALKYAATQVSKEASSSSAQLYAQGLTNAAAQLQGQAINPQSAVQLLQTLIGGAQSPQTAAQTGGSDLLGSLLGGLISGGQNQEQQAAQPAGGDLLGSLLGGLTGGGQQQTGSNSGLDMGDLVNAGMAFMQAKQSGGSNAAALLQAVLAGSGMGNSNHRQQSTQLVASSFLQALGALTGKSQ
jgi:hypothetical protein